MSRWNQIFEGCIIIEKDIGGGRFCRRAIDIDTGEIVMERAYYHGAGLFPAGYNAVERQVLFERQVMFGRDVSSGGSEHITVTDYDKEPPVVLMQCWNNHNNRTCKQKDKDKDGRGRTGGKPSYVKVYENKMDELLGKLKDSEVAFLMRIRPYVSWDTGLLKLDNNPMSVDDMAKVFKSKDKRTVESKLEKLVSEGAIKKTTEGYTVNRQYMAKG